MFDEGKTIAAIWQSLQIYGIAIVISMSVAVLIKVLVAATNKMERPAKVPLSEAAKTLPEVQSGAIPADVIAAISAAVSVITGPHKVLHIAESSRAWSYEGRSAQHSHNPRY